MMSAHRTKFAVAMSVAVFIVVLGGCSSVDSIRHTFVSGRTIDAGSGAPIAGARVAIGGGNAVSDASGSFVVRSERGWQLVVIEAAGYITPSQAWNIDLDATQFVLGDVGLVPASGQPPPAPAL